MLVRDKSANKLTVIDGSERENGGKMKKPASKEKDNQASKREQLHVGDTTREKCHETKQKQKTPCTGTLMDPFANNPCSIVVHEKVSSIAGEVCTK